MGWVQGLIALEIVMLGSPACLGSSRAGACEMQAVCASATCVNPVRKAGKCSKQPTSENSSKSF